MALARPASLGALLRIGPGPLSVYWSNPSRGVYAAGLGLCDAVPVPIGEWSGLGGDMPGPWFGGWAFDAARPWEGFDGERWVLPEVLAWWDGKRAQLVAFGKSGVTEAQLAARLDEVSEVEPSVVPVSFTSRPSSRAAWGGLVEKALAEINRGTCSKLVLARTIDAEFSGAERTLLKSLEARHPQCWTFLVRGRDGRAFIGSSPETLLESHGNEVSIDALAGTCAPGEGAALLLREKERREHAAVIDGIRAAAAPYVDSLQVPAAPVIKPLSNVEHLYTPVRATLKPGADALVLARALHPTPAVAGTPTQFALDWLREHEGFSRGWYAGAVGALGPSGVTLAVALRSALLDGTSAQIFAGAGVVAGSTADAEWQETERKSWAITGGPSPGLSGRPLPAAQGEGFQGAQR